MNISCRIANANTQCGRITNPPERGGSAATSDVQPYKYNFSVKREERKHVFSSEREKKSTEGQRKGVGQDTWTEHLLGRICNLPTLSISICNVQ